MIWHACVRVCGGIDCRFASPAQDHFAPLGTKSPPSQRATSVGASRRTLRHGFKISSCTHVGSNAIYLLRRPRASSSLALWLGNFFSFEAGAPALLFFCRVDVPLPSPSASSFSFFFVRSLCPRLQRAKTLTSPSCVHSSARCVPMRTCVCECIYIYVCVA